MDHFTIEEKCWHIMDISRSQNKNTVFNLIVSLLLWAISILIV